MPGRLSCKLALLLAGLLILPGQAAAQHHGWGHGGWGYGRGYAGGYRWAGYAAYRPYYGYHGYYPYYPRYAAYPRYYGYPGYYPYRFGIILPPPIPPPIIYPYYPPVAYVPPPPQPQPVATPAPAPAPVTPRCADGSPVPAGGYCTSAQLPPPPAASPERG